jgi:hypothetical protein
MDGIATFSAARPCLLGLPQQLPDVPTDRQSEAPYYPGHGAPFDMIQEKVTDPSRSTVTSGSSCVRVAVAAAVLVILGVPLAVVRLRLCLARVVRGSVPLRPVLGHSRGVASKRLLEVLVGHDGISLKGRSGIPLDRSYLTTPPRGHNGPAGLRDDIPSRAPRGSFGQGRRHLWAPGERPGSPSLTCDTTSSADGYSRLTREG